MNVNDGKLMRLAESEAGKQLIEALAREEVDRANAVCDFERKTGLTPVAAELEYHAEKELGDKSSVTVDLEANTPLARWAAERRAQQRARIGRKKSRRRRKIAKRAKMRNRG